MNEEREHRIAVMLHRLSRFPNAEPLIKYFTSGGSRISDEDFFELVCDALQRNDWTHEENETWVNSILDAETERRGLQLDVHEAFAVLVSAAEVRDQPKA